MRRTLFYQSLLLFASLLAGCSANEDSAMESPPDIVSGQEWAATANATLDTISVDDGEVSMRAVFYGGNGRRYYTLWDEGDVVKVYKGTTLVGTMTPSTYGTLTTTLSGTLTGSFSVGESLGVWLPSRAMDFTGQTGTIYNLSSRYSYQQTTTSVTAVSGGTVTLSDVNPSHRAAYLRFVLTDADTNARIHPSQLIISAASGGEIALTTDESGAVTSTGDLVITTEEDNGEYPGELFVAILNKDAANVTYHLKAIVDGDTYLGPVDATFSANPPIGKLNRVLRQLRKTTAASTLTIESIPDQTFTGYDIEPVLTVKDGDDVLTLGDDYSVAYTSNVNVGEATATITGLAESGDVVTTPYSGTKSETFNIVRATPVIEMSTATMEIVAGHSGQTRAVTRVFIDNNGNGTWDEGTDYDITALCSVTYASDNTGVATVNASTGAVSPAASPTEPTTATITATVAAATNWNSQSLSYTVNVETEVNTGNGVDPWGNGGSDSDKIYVE